MISRGFVAALIAGAALTTAALAEDDVASETAPPQVALDDLLGLPSNYQAKTELKAGATRAQWRERFEQARKKVGDAQRSLAEAEKELDQVSSKSSGWQVSAPGGSEAQNSPLSLRLRQEVRDYRRDIEQGVRELRALDVEADLASVPQDWRE